MFSDPINLTIATATVPVNRIAAEDNGFTTYIDPAGDYALSIAHSSQKGRNRHTVKCTMNKSVQGADGVSVDHQGSAHIVFSGNNEFEADDFAKMLEGLVSFLTQEAIGRLMVGES